MILFCLQEESAPVSKTAAHTEFLTILFVCVLLAMAAMYLVHLLVTLVLLPWLHGRPRRVCTSFVTVGPFVLVVMCLTFVLYILEYVAIRDVYREVANPSQVFRTVLDQRLNTIIEGDSDELMNQIGVAMELALEDEDPVVLQNYHALRESGYYSFLESFFRFTHRVYEWFDYLMMAVLVLMMGRQLWVGTSTLLLFPVRRDSMGIRELTMRLLGQLLTIVVYSVIGAAFFLLCAAGLYFAVYLMMSMMVDLFLLYSFEAVFSFLMEQLSPTALFLVSFSFILMMMEIGVVMIVTALLFGFSSSCAIERRCRRWFAKLLSPGDAASLPGPRIGTCLGTFGLFLLKVAASTLIVWLGVRFVLFELFGLTLASYLAAIVQLLTFNALLWVVFRIDRNMTGLVREWFGRRPAVSPPKEAVLSPQLLEAKA